MARQPNAIDFWRGFALVTIFINHVPGIFLDRYTHKNLSLSDSADLFVFLAGWALRLAAGRPEDPTPSLTLLSRLGRRALVLYAAQIMIISVAIAMLAAASVLLDNPLLLEWHNAAPVFYDPIHAHIGLAMLTHQLGYFDILPLYVVLMVFAPVIVLLHRTAPDWLLPISLLIYLVTLIFRISVPTWPTQGQWFFNPLAWQLVFVLGFVLARERGVGGVVSRNIDWIRWAAAPIVLAGAIVVRTGWWPDPTTVPEPKLVFLLSKTFETPARLIQFLALVALFSGLFPYILAWLHPLAEGLSKLGRNSLNVFCVASILSLAGQIARFAFRGSLTMDVVIIAVGISAMWITAWLSEWQGTARGSA